MCFMPFYMTGSDIEGNVPVVQYAELRLIIEKLVQPIFALGGYGQRRNSCNVDAELGIIDISRLPWIHQLLAEQCLYGVMNFAGWNARKRNGWLYVRGCPR